MGKGDLKMLIRTNDEKLYDTLKLCSWFHKNLKYDFEYYGNTNLGVELNDEQEEFCMAIFGDNPIMVSQKLHCSESDIADYCKDLFLNLKDNLQKFWENSLVRWGIEI